jgi:hypothetical protein
MGISLLLLFLDYFICLWLVIIEFVYWATHSTPHFFSCSTNR